MYKKLTLGYIKEVSNLSNEIKPDLAQDFNICDAITLGDYESVSEWLKKEGNASTSSLHQIFMTFYQGVVHKQLRKKIDITWVRDCFNNYCKNYFDDQLLLESYLYLERRFGFLSFTELSLIYNKGKQAKVQNASFYCEVMLNAATRDFVTEQFIKSIFQDGLRSCKPNINLYQAVISACSEIKPNNIKLILEYYYETLIQFDNQSPIIQEIFAELCERFITPDTELFKQYYRDYKDNKLNSDQFADFIFLYLKNKPEFIDFPMILDLLKNNSFKKNHLYNKLLGFAAKGNISVYQYGIPILRYLEHYQMADNISYSIGINMIHRSKEMELRNKKIRWFDYLYQQAKQRSCDEGLNVSSMYIECAVHYPSKRQAAIQVFFDILNNSENKERTLTKLLFILDDELDLNQNEVQQIKNCYEKKSIPMPPMVEFFFHTKINSLAELIEEKNAIKKENLNNNIYYLLIKSITRQEKGSWNDLLSILKDSEKISKGFFAHYEILYYISKKKPILFEGAEYYYKKFRFQHKNTDLINWNTDLIYGKILIQYGKIEEAKTLLKSLNVTPIQINLKEHHYTIDLLSTETISYLQAYLELRQLLYRRMHIKKPCMVIINAGDSHFATMMDVLGTFADPAMTYKCSNGVFSVNIHSQSLLHNNEMTQASLAIADSQTILSRKL